MGINLRDYVKDVNDLFTLEEAERLFIAAGYKVKDTAIEGFENIEITDEILHSNQHNSEQHSNIKLNQNFEIRVKQRTVDRFNLKDIEIQGFDQVFRYTSAPMGGVA
ncbi:hypothetical protein [Sporosarcina sp. USHLN248]|uniref:hypothetical protein n=1 Tax=Sporosarcina sp. USHLN248 TaxID=3081300 RepID=UPI00301A5961